MKKNCLMCGEAYEDKRSDSKFCSTSCKAKHWARKKRGKPKDTALSGIDKEKLNPEEKITPEIAKTVDTSLFEPFENLLEEFEQDKKEGSGIYNAQKNNRVKQDKEEFHAPSEKYIAHTKENPAYISCSQELDKGRQTLNQLRSNLKTVERIYEKNVKEYWSNQWPYKEKAEEHERIALRAKKLKEECVRQIGLYAEKEKELSDELKLHPAYLESQEQEENPLYKPEEKYRNDKNEDTGDNFPADETENENQEDLPELNENQNHYSDSSKSKDKYETDKIHSMLNLGMKKIIKLNFNGKWGQFFGKPQPNFYCVLYGMSGQGKSNFAMQLGKYLAERFGRVLYISGEEGFQASFLEKVEKLGAKVKRYYAAEFHTGEEILEHIPNNYHFIIIDSVNNMDIKIPMMQAIRKKFSQSGIIAICQCTKDGQIRGSYQIVHDGNIQVKVTKGVAVTEKNRFLEIGKEFDVFEVYQKNKNKLPKKDESELDDDFDNTTK